MRVSGSDGPHRLEEQHVDLLVGTRTVLDPVRHDADAIRVDAVGVDQDREGQPVLAQEGVELLPPLLLLLGMKATMKPISRAWSTEPRAMFILHLE